MNEPASPKPEPSTNTRNRRQFLKTGAAGVAAMLAMSPARDGLANTQKPLPAPDAKANPNGRFKDKVVLITGATSGIGKATAYAFAREGAKVFFCGRRKDVGEGNASEIADFGGDATFMQADVRKESDVQALVDACVAKYKRLDIAFNNAGIESPPRTIAEQTLETWNDVMTTNATGVFLCMKYEVPAMLKGRGGVIVNNASVSAHVGFATISPYSASKHAVHSLTKVAALEYADKNIRVNCLSPGACDTPMLRRALKAWNTDFDKVSADYPVKRIIQPEEIARAVMFLASDDATAVIGTDLDVTAGWLTK